VSDLHDELRKPISTWLSQLIATSQACFRESNHEDDQDGDVVREVLRDAGGQLEDRQVEDLIYAIGYAAEVLRGAGEARRALNPELAAELERAGRVIDEAGTEFLMSEAGNAMLGDAWPEDPQQ
jgi:hypothetical protein